MTTTQTKKVPFDPGFAPHTTILSISVPYMYESITQFKNFGQRKTKFKMVAPQLERMAANNVGFCVGSLLWAVYIKSSDCAEIEGNPCLGDTYNREETVEEIDYSIEFFEKLKKDFKYYLGEDYKYNFEYIKVLEVYKDFLTDNKNFVNTKTTEDIVLPKGIIVPDKTDLEKIHSKIEEVIKSGNLSDLMGVFSLIYKG